MTISSFYTPFTFTDPDHITVFVHHWDCEEPEAIVVIAHGMMEHAKRYERLARTLNKQHITVLAPDHRGHGRTADDTGLGCLGPKATWKDWVIDLEKVVQKAHHLYPDKPLFILGHSMGSFIAQAFASQAPPYVKGLILSGTTYESPLTTWFGKKLSKVLCSVLGENKPGTFLGAIVFFRFCRHIPNPKSIHDWLTRDELEVQAYRNDPLCGQTPSNAFFYELFSLLNTIYDPKHFGTIEKQLPLYFYAGTKDPLSNQSKKVVYLASLYRKLGHQISETYYTDGRHEMHHELNRDEVERNILRWIKLHM